MSTIRCGQVWIGWSDWGACGPPGCPPRLQARQCPGLGPRPSSPASSISPSQMRRGGRRSSCVPTGGQLPPQFAALGRLGALVGLLGQLWPWSGSQPRVQGSFQCLWSREAAAAARQRVRDGGGGVQWAALPAAAQPLAGLAALVVLRFALRHPLPDPGKPPRATPVDFEWIVNSNLVTHHIFTLQRLTMHTPVYNPLHCPRIYHAHRIPRPTLTVKSHSFGLTELSKSVRGSISNF